MKILCILSSLKNCPKIQKPFEIKSKFAAMDSLIIYLFIYLNVSLKVGGNLLMNILKIASKSATQNKS